MLMYPDAAHLLHDETQRTSESSTHTHSAQFEANSKAFTWYHQDMGSGLYLQKGVASSVDVSGTTAFKSNETGHRQKISGMSCFAYSDFHAVFTMAAIRCGQGSKDSSALCMAEQIKPTGKCPRRHDASLEPSSTSQDSHAAVHGFGAQSGCIQKVLQARGD